jgi:hypothetical protein
MGWVHRHKHRGAILALIALALQIAVGFSHVHMHGSSGNSHAAVAKQVGRADIPQQAPSQNRSDDDYCAACASIFLVSSAFAPTPPQLPPPALSKAVERAFYRVQLPADAPRLGFRSRAPPSV